MPFFAEINHAWQTSINSLKLVCAVRPLPWGSTLEDDMLVTPEVSAPAIAETQANFALNLIAMICGLGVVVLVCMATAGLDMSVGFF